MVGNSPSRDGIGEIRRGGWTAYQNASFSLFVSGNAKMEARMLRKATNGSVIWISDNCYGFPLTVNVHERCRRGSDWAVSQAEMH